jgi:hypothetical protein
MQWIKILNFSLSVKFKAIIKNESKEKEDI